MRSLCSPEVLERSMSFFEMITWNQIKIHSKKIYVLNTDGFFTHLLRHIAFMEKEGFLRASAEDRIICCQTPVEVFNQLS